MKGNLIALAIIGVCGFFFVARVNQILDQAFAPIQQSSDILVVHERRLSFVEEQTEEIPQMRLELASIKGLLKQRGLLDADAR